MPVVHLSFLPEARALKLYVCDGMDKLVEMRRKMMWVRNCLGVEGLLGLGLWDIIEEASALSRRTSSHQWGNQRKDESKHDEQTECVFQS